MLSCRVFRRFGEDLWPEAKSLASSWMENPTNKDGLLLKHHVRRFRYDDNNVDRVRIQPYNYGVRQVEPSHLFGEAASSNWIKWAHGTMALQQRQRWRQWWAYLKW